jgi:hypothetical protein
VKSVWRVSRMKTRGFAGAPELLEIGTERTSFGLLVHPETI